MKRLCERQEETEISIKHLPQQYHKFLPDEYHKFLPDEDQKKLEDQKPKTNLPSKMTASQLKLPFSDILDADGGVNVEKTEQAVLFIKVMTNSGALSFGTGFLISPNGYFLTCNHVIEDAKEINARTRIMNNGILEDKIYKCELMKTSKDLDIALLKLDGANLPYLSIETDYFNYEYKKGGKVCLTGYPFGERTEVDCSYTEGKISAALSDREPERINLDISGKCGNSGGPVLDIKTGKIIGIFTGSMTAGNETLMEEINQMRPIKYFWKEFVK